MARNRLVMVFWGVAGLARRVQHMATQSQLYTGFGWQFETHAQARTYRIRPTNVTIGVPVTRVGSTTSCAYLI